MLNNTINQSLNVAGESYVCENFIGKNYVGQSVFAEDHNGLYQEYKIVDEPRDGLLEIRLKADNTFITHISTREIYKQFGKSIIHRVISLKNLDNNFAILGSGLYSLV